MEKSISYMLAVWQCGPSGIRGENTELLVLGPKPWIFAQHDLVDSPGTNVIAYHVQFARHDWHKWLSYCARCMISDWRLVRKVSWQIYQKSSALRCFWKKQARKTGKNRQKHGCPSGTGWRCDIIRWLQYVNACLARELPSSIEPEKVADIRVSLCHGGDRHAIPRLGRFQPNGTQAFVLFSATNCEIAITFDDDCWAAEWCSIFS